MKIQIVSEYFYPDNFGINDIAQEIVRAGKDVEYVVDTLKDILWR